MNVPINVEIVCVLLIHDLPMRLLLPRQLAQQTNGLCDGFYVRGNTATLVFGGYSKKIIYNLYNNLPIFSSFPGMTTFNMYTGTLIGDSSHHDKLTYQQRQLLRWHHRLGHMDFSRIQKFSRLGLLPQDLSTVWSQNFPVCPACQFSKQKRNHSKSINGNYVISASDNQPGNCVSVDMIHSPLSGLNPQLRGKLHLERYWYACVFVDHVSNMIFVNFQISSSAEDTIESKHAFEQFALSHGLTIKKYRADNGAFNTLVFKEAIIAANQSINFCAAYAHHQNAIAEHMIQTITNCACSQLIHAMHHWPDVITAELWPYPIKMVVDVHNNSPSNHDLSPVKLFTGAKRQANLNLMHLFGCLAFILDKNIYNGGHTPKWDPRSEGGVYLGLSPDHTSNVGLIFNPKTRHVSPQYHVIYDDDFTSVIHQSAPTWPKIFEHLYQTSRDKPPDDPLTSSSFQNGPTATSVHSSPDCPRQSNTSVSEGVVLPTPPPSISKGALPKPDVHTSTSMSSSEGGSVSVPVTRREGDEPQATAPTASNQSQVTTPWTSNQSQVITPRTRTGQ